MWHILETSVKQFFHLLVAVDRQEAERVQQRGCPCGGRLHHSDYPRKPRGVPAECEAEMSRRISFCCAEIGCRRRSTPPSVRFLGRRVYVAALVLAVSACWVGAEMAQVPSRTASRWRQFFTEHLVKSAWWQYVKGQAMSPEESRLPGSLMEQFTGSRQEVLLSSLQFLAPLTTRSDSRWPRNVMDG